MRAVYKGLILGFCFWLNILHPPAVIQIPIIVIGIIWILVFYSLHQLFCLAMRPEPVLRWWGFGLPGIIHNYPWSTLNLCLIMTAIGMQQYQLLLLPLTDTIMIITRRFYQEQLSEPRTLVAYSRWNPFGIADKPLL